MHARIDAKGIPEIQRKVSESDANLNLSHSYNSNQKAEHSSGLEPQNLE